MRRERIRKSIDKAILQRLTEVDADIVRQELVDKLRKFRERVYMIITDQNFIVSEEMVETLTNENYGTVASKARNFSYYILETENRIIDLYKSERDYNFGFSDLKNYKLLLFKEKLETPKKNIVSEHFPM